MWTRYSERARRVVFFAQQEAGRLGAGYISPEHLLLGLVRENDSVAVRILDNLGVSREKVRNEIEGQATKGEATTGQDMYLGPDVKRAIDLAYDEARQLGSNYVGTEHLLLGLIREEEGMAGRVLSRLGVELEKVRSEVRKIQPMPEPTPQSAPTPPAERKVSRFECYPGDLGIVKSGDESTVMAVRPSMVTRAEFDLVWDARDVHGWRELVERGAIVSLPAGTPVKFLKLEPGNLALIRVVSGEREGEALNILWTGFILTGRDEAPWPPKT